MSDPIIAHWVALAAKHFAPHVKQRWKLGITPQAVILDCCPSWPRLDDGGGGKPTMLWCTNMAPWASGSHGWCEECWCRSPARCWAGGWRPKHRANCWTASETSNSERNFREQEGRILRMAGQASRAVCGCMHPSPAPVVAWSIAVWEEGNVQ